MPACTLMAGAERRCDLNKVASASCGASISVNSGRCLFPITTTATLGGRCTRTIRLRMRHLVPRLLECQLLVMEPFIAGPLQALDRLQRCLKCEGLDAFERLLRYQTICFQSTEADATGRLAIAE